jgi:hypothetical protein
MTQCNQRQLAFAPHFSGQVVVGFEYRQLSTEGGAPLLRETDRKLWRGPSGRHPFCRLLVDPRFERLRPFWPGNVTRM